MVGPTGRPASCLQGLLIRQAVSEFQSRNRRGSDVSLQEALEHTAGIWQSGDGLKYQVRIRKEWL